MAKHSCATQQQPVPHSRQTSQMFMEKFNSFLQEHLWDQVRTYCGITFKLSSHYFRSFKQNTVGHNCYSECSARSAWKVWVRRGHRFHYLSEVRGIEVNTAAIYKMDQEKYQVCQRHPDSSWPNRQPSSSHTHRPWETTKLHSLLELACVMWHAHEQWNLCFCLFKADNSIDRIQIRGRIVENTR